MNIVVYYINPQAIQLASLWLTVQNVLLGILRIIIIVGVMIYAIKEIVEALTGGKRE